MSSEWTAVRRSELLKDLARSGLLDQPSWPDTSILERGWARARGLDAIIEGMREVEGRAIRLWIGLGSRFPHDLPNVYLADPASLPFLPHVDEHGWVCSSVSEGLVLRASAPRELVEDALARALATLANGLSGRNAADTYDELEASWRNLDAGQALVPAYLDPEGELRNVVVAFARDRSGRPSFPYVADTFRAVAAFDTNIKRHATEKTGLLVRLGDSALTERLDPRIFTNAQAVGEYVSRHLPAGDEERLRRLVARGKPWPFVVLNVPRPHGGRSLVGLHYTQVQGDHPLLGGETREPVRYVAFDRRDRHTLLSRGGAVMNLSKAKVAIVGCGAVGGHLAVNLASAGVGSLHLIDPDALATENTFRHALGRSALDVKKVHALRAELDRKYPYLSVTVEPRRVEDAVAAADLDWSSFHIVIVTVGDITVSRWINRALALANTAVVFTWLEPLGIGGHALLAHSDGSTRGCYDCLFWDEGGDETLVNSADFAAPEQNFTRDVTGCASIFTPYANLDAARTAEVAARLALSALSDQATKPRLISWKGDPTQFLQRFRLSPRWDLQNSLSTSVAHPSCPVCQSVP